MLTQQERDDLGKQLTLLAVSYNYDFPKEKAKMYIDSLEYFCASPLERYHMAIHEYISNQFNKTFPTPMQLRALIFKQPDSRDIANELVRKIDKAIMKHGWNWEDGFYHADGNYWEANGKKFNNFREAVIEELGEIGWHVICSRGGWNSVCRSSNDVDEGIYIAQMREQIQSSYSLAKQGIDIARISMPKKQENGLSSSSNIINLLDLKK